MGDLIGLCEGPIPNDPKARRLRCSYCIPITKVDVPRCYSKQRTYFGNTPEHELWMCKPLHIICEIPHSFPNAANYSFMLNLVAMADRCRWHGPKVVVRILDESTVPLLSCKVLAGFLPQERAIIEFKYSQHSNHRARGPRQNYAG